MSKVFITGVAGLLGSHLAEHFLKQGWDVVACDNMLGGYYDNIPKKVKFFKKDCRDLKAMTKASEGADLVYHCAATAYEGLSVFSPVLVTDNIVQATISVLTAAVKNKVKRTVICSSMARYGALPTVPFTEDMEPKPQDPYGIGKLVTEKFLWNLSEIFGMEGVVAVPHNIIGSRQKYDDPFRNVAGIMINLMLQGRQPIIYGDGSQKRSFSFVQDDVDLLYKFGVEKKAAGEVFNIGPDNEFITINELAQVIAKQLNFDLKPQYTTGRPQEVKLANCSADKIRKFYGYKPELNLEEGLATMIEYIRKRGTRKFKYHLPLEIVNEKTPKTWKDRLF